MDFPQSVVEITDKAAADFPSDVKQAVATAEAAIRKLPDFKQLADKLVTKAVQELIFDARHKSNVATKRQAGYYGQEAKVKNAAPVVAAAYKSVYDYFIGSKTLGSLTGEELLDLANKERQLADGHLFNAKLCEQIRPYVKNGQMVKDAIPERRLRTIFQKLYEEQKNAA